MKFAFGALVCLAAALIPAAQANVGEITFSEEKFARRATRKPDADNPNGNPQFGVALANKYTIHKGEGMPAPKDVKDTFPKCEWKSYNGYWGWMDENHVQCYLSPSYKYHAYSTAKAFKAADSLKAGACFDTAKTQDYPDVPRYTIGIPFLYMNNLYDRRCKVRAMVKVPKTDEHEEFWVTAWVIDHDLGYWDETGKENVDGPKSGVLIDTELYPKFFNKNEKDPDFKGVTKVEWFFLDINTQG